MKSRYIQNKILFDWLAFSSKIDSVETIIDLLGLRDVQFIDIYGLYGYTHRLMFGGIGILYGGHDSVMVEMSGQGCRTFETHGNGDFTGLFKYILENNKDLSISRLDIAYDDFNNYLNLELIKDDVINGNYVSKSNNVSAQFSRKNDLVGWTIYAGNKGSNISMRIYDKAAERNATEEYEHWIRCEIQLRRSHAKQFITFLLNRAVYSPEGDKLIDGLRLDSLYFSVLNHFFRIIDNSANNDTNIWRKPIREHWKKFAHSVTTQKISLYVKPGVEYNLLRLDHCCEEQYAGMIYTYIQCHSVDELVNAVNMRKHKLNPKYKNLINERQLEFNALESLNKRRAELDAYWNELTKDCRKI